MKFSIVDEKINIKNIKRLWNEGYAVSEIAARLSLKRSYVYSRLNGEYLPKKLKKRGISI